MRSLVVGIATGRGHILEINLNPLQWLWSLQGLMPMLGRRDDTIVGAQDAPDGACGARQSSSRGERGTGQGVQNGPRAGRCAASVREGHPEWRESVR